MLIIGMFITGFTTSEMRGLRPQRASTFGPG